jgi:hypothetical protein
MSEWKLGSRLMTVPRPAGNLLALATLLKEALHIEQDLAGRLAKHPRQKSFSKQHKEYQQLVEQLIWELERALDRYLTRIATADRPGPGTATRPSGRASAASRNARRRTPAR